MAAIQYEGTEFDIGEKEGKKKKEKKSTVGNFSALHLYYSPGGRKVKGQEEKTACIRAAQ